MELLNQVESLVDSLYWCTARNEPEKRMEALLQLQTAVSCEGELRATSRPYEEWCPLAEEIVRSGNNEKAPPPAPLPFPQPLDSPRRVGRL